MYRPMAGMDEVRVQGCEAGCEHEWGDERRLKVSGQSNQASETFHVMGHDNARVIGIDASQGQFCQRCHGWRGSLGLEPTPSAYVAHLVAVMREVWRVLRDDGTLFLNLGDSYFSGAQHEAVYGKRDKAPEGYQGRGCLCRSLCDVCREAYRRTTHTDGLLVAMLTASLLATTHEHRVSESDHLPSLDLAVPAARSLDATLDQAHFLGHADEQLRASLVSMLGESSPQLLDVCLQRHSHGECLLCGRSLGAYAQEFSRKSGGSVRQSLHNQGSASRADQLGRYSQYKDTACEYCGGILSSEPPYIQPQCTTDRQRSQILKQKDLCGIPWRVALALQAEGWTLRSDIIWAKGLSFCPTYSGSCMPESVHDRPTKGHEYLFLLSKKPRYYYDQEAVRETQSANSHGGTGANGGNKRRRLQQGADGTLGQTIHQVGASGRNLRTVWAINPGSYKEAHFATFPPAIVAPCIKAGTSERGVCPACGKAWVRVTEKTPNNDGYPNGPGGKKRYFDTVLGHGKSSTLSTVARYDVTTIAWQPTCTCDAGDPIPATVLDPFFGAGTTGLVSDRLGRDCIGIDLNADYCDMAQRRIVGDAPLFVDVTRARMEFVT